MNEIIFIKQKESYAVHSRVKFYLFGIKIVETVEKIGKIYYCSDRLKYLFRPVTLIKLSMNQEIMEKISNKLKELNKKG